MFKNLIPDGKYEVDFEKANVGDVFELQMKWSNKIAKGIIIDKDNWNRLFVKFMLEDLNPSYAIIKCQTSYIFSDAHPCIEFNTNDARHGIKNWNERKSKLTKEESEQIINDRKESLHAPLGERKSGSTETMTQWSNYNSKVMGWKGR